MRVQLRFGAIALVLALPLVMVGCASPPTRYTFKRPYSEVRSATERVCAGLQLASLDRRSAEEIRFGVSPDHRAYYRLSYTNEIPDQRCTVTMHDRFTSYPSPYTSVTVTRISDRETRLEVLSLENGGSGGLLVDKRRTELESDLLLRVSDALGYRP